MGDPQSLRDVLASDPLLLTPEEAAVVLSVGRTTIYALMKIGELRPVHIGRSCRLTRAELERYVRRLESPPLPHPVQTPCPRTPRDDSRSARTVRTRSRLCGRAVSCGFPPADVG